MIKKDVKHSIICLIVSGITLTTVGVSIVNVPFLVNTTFLVGGDRGMCHSPVPLSNIPYTDYVVTFESNEPGFVTNTTRSAMMSLYSPDSSKKALDRRSDGARTIELPTYLEADEHTSDTIIRGGDVPCVRFTLPAYFGTLYDSVVTEGSDTFVPFGGNDSVKLMIITFACWFMFGLMCLVFYNFHPTTRKIWWRSILLAEIVFCFTALVAMCVMVFGSLKHPSTYENALCEFRTVDSITGNPKPQQSHNHVLYYDVLVRYEPDSEYYNNGKVWNNGKLCVTSLSFGELGLLQSRIRTDKSLTVTSMWYDGYSPLTLCHKSTSGAFEQSIAPFMHNNFGKVVKYGNDTLHNNWACKVSGTRGVRLVSIGDYHQSVYYYWTTWWCMFALIPVFFFVFAPLVSIVPFLPLYIAWMLCRYMCGAVTCTKQTQLRRDCGGQPWNGLNATTYNSGVSSTDRVVKVRNLQHTHVTANRRNKSIDMENMSFV